jgi:hypothetical protein
MQWKMMAVLRKGTMSSARKRPAGDYYTEVWALDPLVEKGTPDNQ